MFEDLLKSFKISPTQIKVFVGTFLAMFCMVLLQNLGVRSPMKFPKLIIPVPQKADIMDSLRPKLEQKSTKFELKKEHQFVTKAYSASDFDKARAYTVIDMDNGNIILDKNGDKIVPIASLTKIMSAIVALDLASSSEQFIVTDKVKTVVPTIINVTPGEKVTLKEMLEAALITSANDAIEVVRVGIDKKYHSEIFVNAMNDKASFLGLQNTHFTNPQGFDNPENYSSAQDLAKLTQYALTNYPLIAEIVKKDYLVIPASENHKEFTLYNWNGLLDVYPDISGVKIGNTAAAGSTSIVLSARGGERILSVLIGAPGILERDEWEAQLLDAGYQATLGLAPVNVTEQQLREKYATWYTGG